MNKIVIGLADNEMVWDIPSDDKRLASVMNIITSAYGNATRLIPLTTDAVALATFVRQGVEQRLTDVSIRFPDGVRTADTENLTLKVLGVAFRYDGFVYVYSEDDADALFDDCEEADEDVVVEIAGTSITTNVTKRDLLTDGDKDEAMRAYFHDKNGDFVVVGYSFDEFTTEWSRDLTVQQLAQM